MSNSGIVCILANFNSPRMRKVMDFKVTSAYPMITFPKKFEVVLGDDEVVTGYQHLTIPPDLRMHLTGHNKPKKWLESFEDFLDHDGRLKKDYFKLLTVEFPPIRDFPAFRNKTYKGGLFLAIPQLPHWNEHTAYTLELFVTKEDKRSIPKKAHLSGELGTYLPFKYSDIAKTYNKPKRQGNYYILPFSVTTHTKKPRKQMRISV
jgi:hypothetical protein